MAIYDKKKWDAVISAAAAAAAEKIAPTRKAAPLTFTPLFIARTPARKAALHTMTPAEEAFAKNFRESAQTHKAAAAVDPRAKAARAYAESQVMSPAATAQEVAAVRDARENGYPVARTFEQSFMDVCQANRAKAARAAAQ
jgi:hypothetical protein